MIVSNADWLVTLSASVVIGHSAYLGIVFTTLNLKALSAFPHRLYSNIWAFPCSGISFNCVKRRVYVYFFYCFFALLIKFLFFSFSDKALIGLVLGIVIAVVVAVIIVIYVGYRHFSR